MVKKTFEIKIGKELQAWNHGKRAVTLRATREPSGRYRLDLECQNYYWRINRENENATEYEWLGADNMAKATRMDMGISGCIVEIWHCPICELVQKVEALETDTRKPDTGPIREQWPPDQRHLPAAQLPIARLLELLA